MHAVRKHQGHLETRRVVMHRYTDGKTIEIIGVIHIAIPRFWWYINHLLAKRADQGWTVQYEMIDYPDDELSLIDRLAFQLGGDSMLAMVKKLQPLGVMYQEQALHLPSCAQNVDIDAREYVARRWLPTIAKIGTIISHLTYRMYLKVISTKHFLRTIEQAMYKTESSGREQSLTLKRNQMAADACIAAQGNVVTVWGAHHVPDIMKLVARQGFEQIGESWLPALKVA